MTDYSQPWVQTDSSRRDEFKPKCINTTTAENDCRAQVLWLGFFTDFAQRRKVGVEILNIINPLADSILTGYL